MLYSCGGSPAIWSRRGTSLSSCDTSKGSPIAAVCSCSTSAALACRIGFERCSRWRRRWTTCGRSWTQWDRSAPFSGPAPLSTGIGALFAATYPERCGGLVLFDPRLKGVRSPDYPWAPTEEEWRERLAAVRAGWGERGFLESLAREWAPEVADDQRFLDWFVWHMRRSLSPGAALTSFRTAMELDVRDVLAAVRVPVLVIPRPALPGPGHYAAERIRGAEVVELPELRGLYTWVDDEAHQATMEATKQFVSRLSRRVGRRGYSRRSSSPTSLARRSWRLDSATRRGGNCSSDITPWFGVSWRGFRAESWTRQATVSSPPSMDRLAPSSPRRRSATHFRGSPSTFELASIRANARWLTARSRASRSRSALASRRLLPPARCSFRVP